MSKLVLRGQNEWNQATCKQLKPGLLELGYRLNKILLDQSKSYLNSCKLSSCLLCMLPRCHFGLTFVSVFCLKGCYPKQARLQLIHLNSQYTNKKDEIKFVCMFHLLQPTLTLTSTTMRLFDLPSLPLDPHPGKLLSDHSSRILLLKWMCACGDLLALIVYFDKQLKRKPELNI